MPKATTSTTGANADPVVTKLTKPDDVKIGATYSCAITGFQGIAVSRIDLMAGSTLVSLLPKVKMADGVPEPGAAYPDEKSLDWQVLDYVDDGIASRAIAPEKTDVTLGARVKDTITGVTGFATQKATFLNGCIYFIIQPTLPKGPLALDKTTLPKQAFVPASHIQVIKEASSDAKATSEKAAAGKKTGGPSFKMPTRTC